MSEKEKQKQKDSWAQYEPLRRKARDARGGITEIPIADMETFKKLRKELEHKVKAPEAPAMPLKQLLPSLAAVSGSEKTAAASGSEKTASPHQVNIVGGGSATDEYFLMVHKPIDIKHVKNIPDAKAALDAEWQKMRDKRAWLVETV